jgi:hypothetical protein
MQASLFLKVQINIMQKPFSDWSRRFAICFSCCSHSKIRMWRQPSQANELLVHLRTDIKYRQKTTMSMRRICLFISCSGLGGRVNYARIYIEGKYGRGPLDFYLRSLETMVEVKNSAIQSGSAQILMQTHTSLETNQPGANSKIEGQFADKVYCWRK